MSIFSKRTFTVLALLVLLLTTTACDRGTKTEMQNVDHNEIQASATVNATPAAEVTVQPTDMGIEKPWENGGKAINEYTWAEFEALSPELKELFFDAFESFDAFEDWREKEQPDEAASAEEDASFNKPWESGGKAIHEYTWAEFEALSPAQQEMFFDAFETIEAFDQWMQDAKN